MRLSLRQTADHCLSQKEHNRCYRSSSQPHLPVRGVFLVPTEAGRKIPNIMDHVWHDIEPENTRFRWLSYMYEKYLRPPLLCCSRICSHRICMWICILLIGPLAMFGGVRLGQQVKRNNSEAQQLSNRSPTAPPAKIDSQLVFLKTNEIFRSSDEARCIVTSETSDIQACLMLQSNGNLVLVQQRGSTSSTVLWSSQGRGGHGKKNTRKHEIRQKADIELNSLSLV